MRKIGILIDNNSWLLEYKRELTNKIKSLQCKVELFKNHKSVKKCDILFILGCKKILKNELLKKNKLNLVIHESELPKGKGMSPVSNQLLTGKKKIICTMFIATERVDSGPIILRDKFVIGKLDLYEDWREKQAKTTIRMCSRLLKTKKINFQVQKGRPTFFSKLVKEKFKIDPKKTIISQIHKLQAADFKKFRPYFKFKKKIFYIHNE